MRASDGSGVDVPLAKSETDNFTVASWSRANVIIFTVFDKDNASDLWTRSMSDRTSKVFLSSLWLHGRGDFWQLVPRVSEPDRCRIRPTAGTPSEDVHGQRVTVCSAATAVLARDASSVRP
jgi:hypothetical protein